MYCSRKALNRSTAKFISLSRPWPQLQWPQLIVLPSVWVWLHLTLVVTPVCTIFLILKPEIQTQLPIVPPSLLFSLRIPFRIFDSSHFSDRECHPSKWLDAIFSPGWYCQPLKNIFSIIFKGLRVKLRRFRKKECLFILLNFMLSILTCDLCFFLDIILACWITSFVVHTVSVHCCIHYVLDLISGLFTQ